MKGSKGMSISTGDKITICSVGDLMLCDSPLYVSVGVGTNFSRIKEKIFVQCRDEFHSADAVIGNLEGVVHKPKNNGLKEMQMSCREEVLPILKDAGLSIVNLANNHCLQHGSDSLYATEELCKNNGITPIGVNGREDYITCVRGVQFVFLAVCLHPEMYQPDDIIYENDIENIIQKVKEYKRKRMVVVLSVHWGSEFATYPSNKQIMLAHKFVDNGVDILLGHHAHVFQGVEIYKGAIIAYGQGNFVSDMIQPMCRETGTLKISVWMDNNEVKIDYEMIPFYINDGFILEKADGEWFNKRQKELKAILSGEITDDTYKRDVKRNHEIASKIFQEYFKKRLFRYRIRILLIMLVDAIQRKYKKKKRPRNFLYGLYDFRKDQFEI